MDGWQFDALVASLGRTTTRRQWLKAALAGVASVAFGGRRAAANPQRVLEASALQGATSPLPNFPFLAVMPTDSGFSSYAVDRNLTGPPTRYRSIDALSSLNADARNALTAGFQSAYSATVATPRTDAPKEADRAITTVFFDMGSEQAAARAKADYASALFADPLLKPLAGNVPGGKQVIFGGCEGGCENLSRPTLSREAATNEVVAVGQQGQFVFDARLTRYGNEPIDVGDAEAVARLVDARLTDVTSLTAASASATSSVIAGSLRPPASGGTLRRLLAPIGRGRAVLRRGAPSDDLRNGLASRNTLPIFDTGAGVPSLTAVQTLVVDDGRIVIDFGESARTAAARQRSAEDVVFACATAQELPTGNGYRGDYDLELSTVQYVFANMDDAREFLDETRERLKRDRTRFAPTEVSTSDTEVRDVFHEGRESSGLRFGCISHQILDLGAVDAVLAVEITAVPRAPGSLPISASDLENDICPVVADAAATFALCIFTPDQCQSAFPLSVPGTAPTPTPTPACPAPNAICNGACVDVSQDPSNCGGCGNACDQLRACVAGQCLCLAGLADCGGSCVDVTQDSGNCGDCGVVCDANEYCAGGTCVCANGEPPCGGSTCCAEGTSCNDGTCEATCQAPQMDCGGKCVDPTSDTLNCGGCGVDCGGGSCCGGYCSDPATDPANCGACGYACDGGSCCGGQCIDTLNDPNNCGSCGNGCPDIACCGGACTDTFSDSNNCGGCGIVCEPSSSCYSGTCLIP